MARRVQKQYTDYSGRKMTGKELGAKVNHLMKITNSKHSFIEVGKGDRERGVAQTAWLIRQADIRRTR